MSMTRMVLLAAAATAATCAGADEPKAEHKLIGTWQLVSAKYGGKEFAFPAGTTMLKHVTPSQFMWATYDQDGKVSRAAGGGYTLKGDEYAETPEYGLGRDFEVIKGGTHTFKWKVEGNRWH